MYCSEDCQEKSWDYGHKEFCHTRRGKLLESKHKKIIPSCRGTFGPGLISPIYSGSLNLNNSLDRKKKITILQ